MGPRGPAERAAAECGRTAAEAAQRLVEAADLPTSLALSERLTVRLPQLTYGVLFLENDVTGPTPPRPPLKSMNPAAADAVTMTAAHIHPQTGRGPPQWQQGEDRGAVRLAAPTRT